jgi:nitronate monooxygenase
MSDATIRAAQDGSPQEQCSDHAAPASQHGESNAAWPDRRLCDLLQIEHPLVLAPMGGFGTVELAASVCRAGGLGSLGCVGMPPHVVMQAIEKLRALTGKPVNVNFFSHTPAQADPGGVADWRDRLAPYYREFGLDPSLALPDVQVPAFDASLCSVVEACRPEVVSFHFGLPEPSLLARVKAAGCRVMSSATTVAEARWLEARGADVVIAQGSEAGGHRGMFLATDSQAVASQPGTFALVPQIADAVGVPVIAAGGIADPRGVAAAFALGAAGVQMGTAYLLCPEAATSPSYRDALRHAGAAGTVLTNVFTGRPARAVGNRLTRELGPISGVVSGFPSPMAALAPLRTQAEQQGCRDFTPFWVGQAAALAREMPAEALTRALATAALARIQQLAG